MRVSYILSYEYDALMQKDIEKEKKIKKKIAITIKCLLLNDCMFSSPFSNER